MEIRRKGKIVKIIAEETQNVFQSLKPHNIVQGDPNDLVHLDWSGEWKGEMR